MKARLARSRLDPRKAGLVKNSTEFDIRTRTERLKAVDRSATGTLRVVAGQGVMDCATYWLSGDRYDTQRGESVVHQRQYFAGLPVYTGSRVVKYRAGVPLKPSAGGYAIPDDTLSAPRLTCLAALETALDFLKSRKLVRKTFQARIGSIQSFNLPERPQVLIPRPSRKTTPEPIRTHLVIFPRSASKARVAWLIDICPEGRERFEVVVSADRKRASVLHCTQANSCAFTTNWVTAPGKLESLETFPLETFAWPLGDKRPPDTLWETGTGLIGPNAASYVGEAKKPVAMGKKLAFDNPFVWCNYLHDFFKAFGFDSSLGAFDENEDRLEIRTFLDSKPKSGGVFDNHVDGMSPRMELYGSPHRDGKAAGVDPSIVIHEYTHGVTNRILGGKTDGAPFRGDDAQGLNEGYSDYFALTILNYLNPPAAGAGPLTTIGGDFEPGGPGMRRYARFAESYLQATTAKYRLAQIWCSALLHGRKALVEELRLKDDHVDRFVWRALILSLKAMTSKCVKHDSLTVPHAGDALITAMVGQAASHASFTDAPQTFRARLGDRGIAW